MGLRKTWDTFTKPSEECNIDELKKKQKINKFFYFFCFIIGEMTILLSLIFYFKTSIIGLPILLTLIGMLMLIYGLDYIVHNRTLSLFIYLKNKEEKQ